ncbi:MAG TPA: septal ring lytic transglycosylase RlpA family protein [Terriglobales bacterium]|nr:septal ring lytic transglycosylase RlpA family protein [Terriglobales bacterium]
MRRRIANGLAILLSVASLGAGAAQGPNSSDSSASPSKINHPKAVMPAKFPPRRQMDKPFQVGKASWYGESFEGKPTASGEPYDMHDFTAAHPTLPLGTYVKVTNLSNRRSVIVRINDRGPVIDGRIIDVSYNAAKALEFKNQGIQRVRLDLVRNETVAMAQQVEQLANLP